MIAIYPSINLYAQLAIVAEIPPKPDDLRLSAGTVLVLLLGITVSVFLLTSRCKLFASDFFQMEIFLARSKILLKK